MTDIFKTYNIIQNTCYLRGLNTDIWRKYGYLSTMRISTGLHELLLYWLFEHKN